MGTRAGLPARDGLIGRTSELETLGRFLDGLGSGGGTLLLSGEPGVGKTALLDEAARADGVEVLRTAGTPYAASGYAALQEPLDLLSHQRRLLSVVHREALDAVLDGTGPATGLLVVSEAILELLRTAAGPRPLLFLVDDLQWLDPASSRVLGLVARRLPGSRVGLLATLRTGEAGFFERSGLAQHEVGPLDPSSAAVLLDSRSPDLGDAVRRHVLTQSSGNPLALIELPAALVPEQRSGRAELPEVLPLTRRLQQIYASALGRLEPPTRRLLVIAALDGSEDLRIQLRAARADLDTYSSAEHEGLVSVDVGGGRVSFRHPLIRAAVVDVASEAERRSAHAALAEAVPEGSDRRAWHLAEATRYPDEGIAAQLEQAGRRLLHRGEAVAAVRTILVAGDLSPDAATRRRRLAEAAYVGAHVTGGLQAVPTLVEQADGTATDAVSTALATAYLVLNSEGDVTTAHRLLVAALRDAPQPAAGDEAVLEALHTLQLICFFGGRPALWQGYREAVSVLGDRVPASLWLTSQTFSDPARTAAPVLPELDAAIDALGRETDPREIVRIGVAGFYVDRLAGCRHALWRVVEDGRSGGAVASSISALLLIGFDEFLTGEWDDAERLSDEALRLCDRHGYRLLSWPGLLARGLLAAARGDDELARATATDMLDWALPRGVRAVELYAAQVQASAALARGDAESAYRHATRIGPPGSFPSHVAHALPVAFDLVEAAVRSGRRTEAAAHVQAMRQAGLPGLSDRLAFLTAGAAAMAASPEDAPDAFRHALTRSDATRWPFEQARLHLAFGEQLRGTGDLAESRRHLQAALQIFTRLRARPWARRAAVEARAGGRATPGLLGRSLHALSEQEREVVRLAAAGLTNREIGRRLFLSHRTVGAHLYRAFPKLGVTSRAALRDALASLRRDDGTLGRREAGRLTAEG